MLSRLLQKRVPLRVIMVALVPLIHVTGSSGQERDRSNIRIEQRAERRLEDVRELFDGWHHVGEISIDSIRLYERDGPLRIYFSNATTHIPVRYPWVEHIRASLMNRLGFRFRNYQLELIARGRPFEDYIPNYYRAPYIESDRRRIRERADVSPLVRRADRPGYAGGLSGSHITLWPSHGYYYEAERDRWEWQRARLYGTIEDLYPFSYIKSYLLPMLENAGAYILMPRERDLQSHEVIVDMDGSTGSSEIIIEDGSRKGWEILGDSGFAMRDTLFEGDNPFRMGSHFRIETSGSQGAALTYIPDIPEDGEYAVYVSWAEAPANVDSVSVTVRDTGGETLYLLNQTMGWGTWVYLGTHHFTSGKERERGSVTFSGDSPRSGHITADAVRFGGGMGNIARRPSGEYVPRQWSFTGSGSPGADTVTGAVPDRSGWKTSQRPRYMEGARYYLQYAGMPDSLVYSINLGRNDYNDDFMSRGEWVNYLSGAPMGVTGEPAPGNPGIPVDLSLAFHTDAGVTPGDSVIGTLAIYSSERDGGVFHNGQSRLASRDLSDIIQTQIVNDIRLMANRSWTRRGLWDRQYSEAWRPQVPAMLLELLSHQNLADMNYGLDPRFRFIVSRAIYKGILLYRAGQNGRDAIVQPLPPDHMSVSRRGGNIVRLSWEPVEDPLEPSASPSAYRVYTRQEKGGFDPGVEVAANFLDLELPERGKIYSFRVTAVNEGGESLPGEILSASLQEDDDRPVLVVNAFRRVCGPAVFDQGGMAGIAWWDDMGVPDRYDFSHTGVQYDFFRSSAWLDDDSPGWGASHADMEMKILPGNSFDFPALYGEALRDAGHSFVSVSREVFEQSLPDPENREAVIVIFGEERGTPRWDDPSVADFRVFTPGMMAALQKWADGGGNIFVSGAYLGTDMVEKNDTAAIRFAGEVLGFTWRTNHATSRGEIMATGLLPPSFPRELKFNSGHSNAVYTVEAPDAIEPAGEDVLRIYRYATGKTSAGVLKEGRHRVVALGFPFEAIICRKERLELMTGVMGFFGAERGEPLPGR